ncbi:MAG: hypothetical protein HQM04_04735 [Magnetococcales bacterium]|nr:hypothetical protein [Magnetococcales bacterium]MBF0114331.1 hypothetical protein [Magnetococcales bacterium]
MLPTEDWYERLSRRERVGLLLVGCALLLAMWYRWQWLPFAAEWQRWQPRNDQETGVAAPSTAPEPLPWQTEAASGVPLAQVGPFIDRLSEPGGRIHLLGRVVAPAKPFFSCAAQAGGEALTLQRHALQLTWEGGYGEVLATLQRWQQLPWPVQLEQLAYTRTAQGITWRLQLHFISVIPNPTSH